MSGEQLLEALKDARAKEQARLDALAHIRDLRSLRLLALHDALKPQLDVNAAARGLFELNLDPGETPRLWLDMHAHVTMAPDPKTFRLQSGNAAPLLETPDMEEMKRFILQFMAHEVAGAAGPSSLRGSMPKVLQFSMLETILVGLLAFALGLFVALAYALHAGLLELH